MSDKKSCFVIAPIGSDGSDERKRSDTVLKYIIMPVTTELGYTTIRADQISEPGIITTQIIDRLTNDDLVIADLTDHNPNVFYELCVRHATHKPVVQMIDREQKIPFDIAAARTILLDTGDFGGADRAKNELIRQIKSLEQNSDSEMDNPLSTAIQLQALRVSNNPIDHSSAKIIDMLANLSAGISSLREDSQNSKYRETHERTMHRLRRLMVKMTTLELLVNSAFEASTQVETKISHELRECLTDLHAQTISCIDDMKSYIYALSGRQDQRASNTC